MKQAGRKSEARLAIVTPITKRNTPPPADLSPEQAAVWVRIVAEQAADYWGAGNLPVLAQLCRVTVEAERIGQMVDAESKLMLTPEGNLRTYQELRRMQGAISSEMAALATKLRLTQQSRYRADKAHPVRGGGRRPWQSD